MEAVKASSGTEERTATTDARNFSFVISLYKSSGQNAAMNLARYGRTSPGTRFYEKKGAI